jgi:putative transposase
VPAQREGLEVTSLERRPPDGLPPVAGTFCPAVFFVAMRRSKTEIYLHVVWATREREPLLVGTLDQLVRREIESEARKLGCPVLGLNGMPDHLHLLVRVPGRISAAELAKQVKGASSHAANGALPDGQAFRWQEGYGAFSVSRSHLARVATYIEHQAERHARGDLWTEWEETDEEASG